MMLIIKKMRFDMYLKSASSQSVLFTTHVSKSPTKPLLIKVLALSQLIVFSNSGLKVICDLEKELPMGVANVQELFS